MGNIRCWRTINRSQWPNEPVQSQGEGATRTPRNMGTSTGNSEAITVTNESDYQPRYRAVARRQSDIAVYTNELECATLQ